MSPLKEQDEAAATDLGKMEISGLREEFLIIKILTGLERRVEEISKALTQRKEPVRKEEHNT